MFRAEAEKKTRSRRSPETAGRPGMQIIFVYAASPNPRISRYPFVLLPPPHGWLPHTGFWRAIFLIENDSDLYTNGGGNVSLFGPSHTRRKVLHAVAVYFSCIFIFFFFISSPHREKSRATHVNKSNVVPPPPSGSPFCLHK